MMPWCHHPKIKNMTSTPGVLRNGVPQSCSVWVSPRWSGGCSRAHAASLNTNPRSFRQWWCTPNSSLGSLGSQCPLASKNGHHRHWASLGHVLLIFSAAKHITDHHCHCRSSSSMGRIPKGVLPTLPPTRSTIAWLSGKSKGSQWIPSLLAAFFRTWLWYGNTWPGTPATSGKRDFSSSDHLN